MKIKLLLSAFAIMLCMSSAFASFPVKRASVATETTITTEVSNDEVSEAIPAAYAGKDKWIAAALWFVLGGFAAHRWYIGSPWYWNVLYILTLGFFIVGHIIDIVQILTDSYPGL
ncbi:TM2 domain-containing protein [Winogradskyella poriferorum]|uniref:TM2 domain-containing protein n=1 Tax=Winogradskyella poriferorum TaxID=307627 RepID=UPI003D6463CC